MNFLTLQLCRRLRYCAYDSTIVNNIVKRCSHVAGNKEHVSEPIKSKLFPDYNVVYNLPYITVTYILSRLKRNCTIVTGAVIPISLTVNLLDFIPIDDCFIVIATCCVMTILLHATGYLYNNVIGSMCIKDKEKIVISYINYWGTRIDLKTDINNVELLSEIPMKRLKFGEFRYLKIKSPEKKLKLFVAHGKIYDKSEFHNIVGNYE
ncbi:uncharacterized protein LOC108625598 [Ceratina calcarata]|uniref:Transmembrane protein 186 n=1 Tax=Ceratina calcarata TaxID=156304 RepID=A0AAJ7RXG9_9HYME|nr:uncharacterized protein LOC108625598 [Ceratina calcarata]